MFVEGLVIVGGVEVVILDVGVGLGVFGLIFVCI